MIRSSHWMFRYPGMAYAGDLRFNVPVLERDARGRAEGTNGRRQVARGH